jgi:nitrite reductase/ring-hydroxylating ferredoxin subunit
VRVCASDELAPGEMIGATLDDRPIVVVRTRAGELQAYVDRCLHQGARLSGGRLLEAVEGDAVGDYRHGDADVIKCPWHGYEYDAASGCALFDRRRRLRPVRVREEDGWIVAGDRVSAGSGGEDGHVEQPGGLTHGSAAR